MSKVVTLTKWGYRGQPFVVDTLRVHVRPHTTDEKVIAEVLTGNEYQNKTAGLFVEPDDVWLDLGGNIGTFSLLALAAGGRVVAVEPEPENLKLLRANLAANFPRSAYAVVPGGAALRKGTLQLYLANGDYNKYRHSTVIAKGNRASISVPVHGFGALLRMAVGGRRVNALKIDIEGAEIAILEQWGDKLGHLKKFVCEYTFYPPALTLYCVN